MSKEGIGCSVHFIPLHIQPYWRDKYKIDSMQFPESIKAYNNAVSLPIYPRLNSRQQKRVIKAIHKLVSKKYK